MRLVKRVLKRRQPVLWIGALRDIITRVQGYYSMFNMPMLVLTLYTVRMESIRHYVSWLTLPVLIWILLVGIIILILMDWKLVHPSQVAHHQHLAWQANSPARLRFENQGKRLDNIENELKGVKAMQAAMYELLKGGNNATTNG